MINNYSEANLAVITAFLRGKGLNEYAVFGLVGNIYAESRLRPDNLQNSYEPRVAMNDEQFTKAVDSGEFDFLNSTLGFGYGLCQWTSKGRRDALYNYIKASGRSIADINAQLEFMWVELTGSYKKSTLNVLLEAKSVDEAARVVITKYEKPASQGKDSTEEQRIKAQDVRVGYAQEFYDKYAIKEREQTVSKIKIAIDAGHGLKTAGKRCMKKLDANETREWVLNSRIANILEALLKPYNCEVLRVDDVTGVTDISNSNRAKRANEWGADIYISIHHNAGLSGRSGGGTVVYYSSSKPERPVQANLLYKAVVAQTGLVGNRSSKVIKKGFTVIKKANAPSFLIENGFMDSPTDVPIILSEDHANKTAQGLLNFLVTQWKLTKLTEPEKDEPEANDETVYRVQCGAFRNKANAEALRDKLKADGYEAVVVSGS